MPLTVKDILEKTFKRSFKGYDEDEVDRFLDQVIDEFKALQAENDSLRVTLAETNERLNRVSETEVTIMNTLVSAQKSSERLLAEAARKAELIIGSAQATATRCTEQTKTEVALAEKRLEELRGYASLFAESFANMVNSQAASFQQAYLSYFGDPDVSHGINVDAARRISADVETGLRDISAVEPEDEPAATQPANGEADAYDSAETEPYESEPADVAPTTDEPMEAKPAAIEEPAEAAEPKFAATDEPAQAAPPAAMEASEGPVDTDKGVLSLQEINMALRELEEQDGSTDNSEDGKEQRPRYDDYSWLYDSDSTEPAQEIVGKDDEELKSLIDEVID